MRLSDAPADTPPNPRKSARSATGIGGVCGNKGGLVMALTYRTTSLAFISCHLAAHDHKARDMAETAAEMRPRYSRDRGTRPGHVAGGAAHRRLPRGARRDVLKHRPPRSRGGGAGTSRRILSAIVSRRLHKPMAPSLSQFDHVFWLGDLNFRIDAPQLNRRSGPGMLATPRVSFRDLRLARQPASQKEHSRRAQLCGGGVAWRGSPAAQRTGTYAP